MPYIEAMCCEWNGNKKHLFIMIYFYLYVHYVILFVFFA